MKIIAVACSPRKGKTTKAALEVCLAAAREVGDGIETELLELAGLSVNGCIACGKCRDGLVCTHDDGFTSLVPALSSPDLVGLIVGTPVYFGSMTSQCKAFLDRCVMFRRNGFLFRSKVGGALAVGGVRNGGQELTIQAIHAAMLCHDMVVVGDGQPTAHFGAALWSGGGQGVADDDIGLETARNLGRRVAEVCLRLAGA
ncbi:MAG TPA: flavodoxin family protein [Phycisphaerae bacterium]|nr:flavodoxin family protein [Phycisphaerae bacterium]